MRELRKKPVVLVGMGNVLMKDEGVGCYLVEELKKRSENFDDVEFLEAGLAGLSVVHYLSGRKKAVFVDCADMKSPPGTIKRFSPGDAVSVKMLSSSSHDADVLKILKLASMMEISPQEVVIFGIQPDKVEPGEGLTPLLREKLGGFVKMVSKELG